jgi:hypothetical protein
MIDLANGHHTAVDCVRIVRGSSVMPGHGRRECGSSTGKGANAAARTQENPAAIKKPRQPACPSAHPIAPVVTPHGVPFQVASFISRS